jgi:hypothetical protein
LIHNRITGHPDINFTVVINPASGPGLDSLPDANYSMEIPKMTAHANVRVLGYVATTYATRAQDLVMKDVQTYANWPTNSSNPGLAVKGIFFDETPQQYSAGALTYFEEITAAVKKLPGLGLNPYVCIFPVFCFLSLVPAPYLDFSLPHVQLGNLFFFSRPALFFIWFLGFVSDPYHFFLPASYA